MAAAFRVNQHPIARSVILGVLSIALVTFSTGCRTPWRTNLTPEPSFDRLIEIEQQSSLKPSERSPLASKLRPGSARTSADRYAPADTDRDLALAPERREAEAEFQDPDTLANPMEQEILARTMNALKNRRRAGTDTEIDDVTPQYARDLNDTVAQRSSTAERRNPPPHQNASSVTDDSPERGVSFSLSDDDDELGETLDQESPPHYQFADQRRLPSRDRIPREDSYVRTASGERPITELLERDDLANQAQRYAEQLPDDADEFSPSPGEDLTQFELRELAHAMIAKLNESQKTVTNPDERIDLAKKRRLLNIVLDDLNAAQEPIEGMQVEAQEYVRNTFQGLFDATDLNGNPVASRRLTLALQSHQKAARSLAKLANLEVHNLALCTDVDSFGVITKFPQYQFRPDQEVLLYCELENFVSEKVQGGFLTQLQGSYEIIDSNGQRVADQLLPEDSDTCGNQRRDFYIAYRLHLPEEVEPGRYDLKLTIEDMKGHKFGQSTIEFQIIR